MARVRDEVVDRGPKPASDAYVGLLAISLGAMMVGCALLFMDYSQYGEKAPPKAPTPMAVQTTETPAAGGAAQPQAPAQ